MGAVKTQLQRCCWQIKGVCVSACVRQGSGGQSGGETTTEVRQREKD